MVPLRVRAGTDSELEADSAELLDLLSQTSMAAEAAAPLVLLLCLRDGPVAVDVAAAAARGV